MGWKHERASGTKADGWWGSRSKSYHQWIKRQKMRLERRRAKHDPECKPGYDKYDGYES
jgi:hypothetical protein